MLLAGNNESYSMNPVIIETSRRLGQELTKAGWCVATAESCTGGGVAAAITAVPNSSRWFEYGIVSYANQAKQTLLGVSEDLLNHHGAVSEPVVKAMVTGVLKLSGGDIAVAISGIAGPGGGSLEKPVGSVWFCWGTRDGKRFTKLHHFEGDRQYVQEQAIITALDGLVAQVCGRTTV